jgi:hypothetical protein
MTRQARFMTIRAGLLAVWLAGCAHTGEAVVRAPDPPQPVRQVTFAQAPPWPVEAGGAEEAQGAPPEQPAAPAEPREASRGAPASPDGRAGESIQQTHGLLNAEAPSLLAPGGAPAAAQAPVADPPPAREEPIVLALRSLLNDRPEEALQHLKDYDASNQEALICLTAAVARLTKKKLDQLSPAEVAALQAQLQKSLLCALRPRAELVIDKLCCCEWIRGYGVYKPLPEEYEFQPRMGDRPGEAVQLYVELRNLTSEPHGDGYDTRLQSAVRLSDASGKDVFRRAFPERDNCFRTLTPLPHFFKGYSFFVPCLPPGQYTLTMEVRDVTRPDAPRVATRVIPFRVAAPPGGP